MARKKNVPRGAEKRHPLVDEWDAFLREHRPDYYADLEPGVSAAEIIDLERLVGYEFPPLLRDLYLWRNGVSPRAEPFGEGLRSFLPLSQVRERWIDRTSCQESPDCDDPPQEWCRGWIPIQELHFCSSLCVDLHGSFTGKVGQLLEFWHGWEDRTIIAPSIDAWLANLLENFRAGNWGYDEKQSWIEKRKPKKIPGYPIRGHSVDDLPKRPLPERRPILSPQYPDEPLAWRIAGDPESARLSELDLKFKRIGPIGVRELVSSPHLRQLKSLNLMSCELGDAGAQILADAENLSELTRLEVGWNSFSPHGVAALCGSPLASQLSFLGLRGQKFGDEGVQVLAQSPSLKSLERLELHANSMSAGAVRSLVRSRNLKQLRELDLSSCDLTDDALEELAATTTLKNIERIDLECNQFGLRGALALVRSKGLRKLRVLDLVPFPWTKADLAALAREPALERWRALRLSGADGTHKPLGKAAVAALTDSKFLGNLASLELTGFNLANEGLRVLARTLHLPSLTELKIQLNGADASKGFRDLVTSPRRAALKCLEWIHTPLDGEAVEALATSKQVRLQSLSFEGCRTTPQLPEILASSENFQSLRRLSLRFVSLTIENVRALLASPHLKKLTHLDIAWCGLTPQIAQCIAESDGLPNVVSLTVTGTEVRQRGEAFLRKRLGEKLVVESN